MNLIPSEKIIIGCLPRSGGLTTECNPEVIFDTPIQSARCPYCDAIDLLDHCQVLLVDGDTGIGTTVEVLPDGNLEKSVPVLIRLEEVGITDNDQ